jgi:CDP-diglyceride synthetase
VGGYISSILLFAIISFFGTLEFYRLSSKFASPYQYYGASFSSTIVMALGVITYNHDLYWILGALVIYMIRFVILLLKSRSKTAIIDISITIAGALYVALPYVSLLFLGILDTFDPAQFNWQITLSIFILTWVNDTGAYPLARSQSHNTYSHPSMCKLSISNATGVYPLAWSASYTYFLYHDYV